jgi:putative flippase GtrA
MKKTAGAFVRFVVCGGGVGLLSSGALVLAAGHTPFAVANAVVTVVSTLLATELHHRVTFRGAAGGGWAGWRVHSKSALTLLAAYLFTTAAVLLLGQAHPHPGPLLTQAVYLAASGLAGIARFAALRLLVFTQRPAHTSRTLDRDGVTVAA